MKKRGVGLLLVLTVIVALGTLVQNYRFDNSRTSEGLAAQSTDGQLAALEATLVDLRFAQAAYFVAGQEPGPWMATAEQLIDRIETELNRLRDDTLVDGVRARYNAALGALADLRNIDARVRSHIGDNERLLASDLVFMEGLDASQRVRTEVAGARGLEQLAAADLAQRLAWMQFGMNGLALAFLLSVALSSLRARTAAEEHLEAIIEQHDRRPVASDATPVAVDEPQPEPEATQAPAAPAPVAPARLADAAALCMDLARLLDGRDLPALVARTAHVLDASGVVVWTVAGTDEPLRPALTHGYPDRVVARLGSLPIDADNVTSLAFRSMQPQMMNGEADGASGAVAVPLVTTTGCVGVLAAETSRARPGDEMMALARILAAQFSVVVAPAAETTVTTNSEEASG